MKDANQEKPVPRLSDLKRVDGSLDFSWVGPDDCYYQTQTSYLMDWFGFCGCGVPEDALRYIRDAMRLCKPDRWNGHDDCYNEWYKEWRAKVDAVFGGNDGAEYFMWYFLDSKNLTEHGGSVPGWLTSDGVAFLADLESLRELNEEPLIEPLPREASGSPKEDR